MNDPEPTDQEAIARFQADGDPRCLEMLVRRHTGRVRAVVLPLVLNDADADDVAQDAMLRALAGLRTFRGEAAFTSWLHRIAVNTAKNLLRRRGRDRALLVDDYPVDEVVDPIDRSPARVAEALDMDRAIAQAMARLPADQRVALSLVAIQGLDDREAARVAGCRAATFRWRLHRARERMREWLGTADGQGRATVASLVGLRSEGGVCGHEG